ncbi:MAG: lipopolysaccharide biosynthesis protein [Thermoanaerobaculia bacterium]
MDVGLLAGGAAAGQVLYLFATPFLTRIYGPAEMGIVALFTAFAAVASVASMLRYESAIVPAADESDAASLLALCLALCVVIGAICGCVLGILQALGWAGFHFLPRMAPVLMFIYISAVGGLLAGRAWLVRTGRFRVLGSVPIWQNAGRAGVQVGLGVLGAGTFGLIAGEVAGRIFGVRVALGSAVREAQVRLPRSREAFRVLGSIAGKYREFPTYSLGSSLVDTLAVWIPLPLITAYFGPISAGHYSLASRILTIPAGLVAQSVGDVFFNRISIIAREAPARATSFLVRVAAMLAVAAAVPCIVVSTFGPEAFVFAFGEQWRTAGVISTSLVWWAAAQMVVSPISRAVFVFGGLRSKFVYDVVALTMVLLTFVVAQRVRADFAQVIGWLTLGNVVAYAVYFVVLIRVVSRGR